MESFFLNNLQQYEVTLMDSSINEITEQVNEIYNKCVSDIDTEEEQYDDQINRAL